MKTRILLLISFASLLLAACGSAPILSAGSPAVAVEQTAAESNLPQFTSLDRLDEQGAVTVAVLPTNLDNPGETLDFRIGLNTHSVDLSMDLAVLSTLETDTGLKVEGLVWDAPQGGHHVNGVLSFPAAIDGQPLLEGADTLTLIIRDVDAPARIFTWDLSG